MTKGGSGKVGRGRGEGKRQTRSLLTEFLDALALEGRSPHSVRSYRRDLEPLVVALPARLDRFTLPICASSSALSSRRGVLPPASITPSPLRDPSSISWWTTGCWTPAPP